MACVDDYRPKGVENVITQFQYRTDRMAANVGILLADNEKVVFLVGSEHDTSDAKRKLQGVTDILERLCNSFKGHVFRSRNLPWLRGHGAGEQIY